jgi:hypothetical protein
MEPSPPNNNRRGFLGWLAHMPSGKQSAAFLALPIISAPYLPILSFHHTMIIVAVDDVMDFIIPVVLLLSITSLSYVILKRRTLTGVGLANAVTACLPMFFGIVLTAQKKATRVAYDMAEWPSGFDVSSDGDRYAVWRSNEFAVAPFVLLPGLVAVVFLPIILAFLRRKQIRWGEGFVYLLSATVYAAISYSYLMEYFDTANDP